MAHVTCVFKFIYFVFFMLSSKNHYFKIITINNVFGVFIALMRWHSY